MFHKEDYVQRRAQLKKQVGSGLILLLGNEESSMNYKDNWYHFRQDSSFLYFIGLDKPGLAAVIDIDKDTVTIYGDEATVDDIVWIGVQQSLREEAEGAGVSVTKPSGVLASEVKNAVSRQQPVHFLPPYRPEHLLKLSSWLGVPPHLVQKKASVPLIKAVVAQRSIKSPEEVAEIEKAVNISVDMHLAAAGFAAAGMTEAEVASQLYETAVRAGGKLAFPAILTVNGQILHNHYTSTVLQKGQLVICDSGAETAMHYGGDLTRTFPVDKQFTNQQKELYEIVLHAHTSAVDMLKPGVLYKDVHLEACEKLVEELQQIGLMKGDVQEAVAQGAHAQFFPCGLGHMMGLDTHDMENLGEEYVGYTEDLKKSTQFGLKSLRLGRALEEGFVLTVEPGLYFNPNLMDMWAAENKFTQFINYNKLEAFRDFGGIRIEEDFLITPEGSRLLGKPLPKTVEGIEALRNNI
ncbi:aminopeptidase P family protein [Pontibacter pamirensis]|uniref:aminopeptidase P family protein n=1 Tax=Pontibacter pamirensis TaxID=2562824 RepID=UPI0013896C13|nr:aminopeptidase P family protein [Pontibacter pamirensis]